MKMLLLFLLSLNALADCNVHIPEKEFYHAALTIHFDFTSLLKDKGYTEVNDPSVEKHLLIEGIEGEGRFHRAIAVIKMNDLKVEESVVCLTQLCAINDYAKAFNRAYKSFAKKLPACSNNE